MKSMRQAWWRTAVVDGGVTGDHDDGRRVRHGLDAAESFKSSNPGARRREE